MSIITLPRSAVKEINDKYIKIDISEADLKLSYGDLEIIKKTKGILSKKKADKLIHEIEKSRDDWERL